MVIMYKCNICGTEFDEPRVIDTTENLDGESGWEKRREVVCPVCCTSHFEDVSDTPEIILRFRDFLAPFDPADVKELEYELDSIDLVRYWREH